MRYRDNMKSNNLSHEFGEKLGGKILDIVTKCRKEELITEIEVFSTENYDSLEIIVKYEKDRENFEYYEDFERFKELQITYTSDTEDISISEATQIFNENCLTNVKEMIYIGKGVLVRW